MDETFRFVVPGGEGAADGRQVVVSRVRAGYTPTGISSWVEARVGTHPARHRYGGSPWTVCTCHPETPLVTVAFSLAAKLEKSLLAICGLAWEDVQELRRANRAAWRGIRRAIYDQLVEAARRNPGYPAAAREHQDKLAKIHDKARLQGAHDKIRRLVDQYLTLGGSPDDLMGLVREAVVRHVSRQ